jgi:hypothetical protein
MTTNVTRSLRILHILLVIATPLCLYRATSTPARAANPPASVDLKYTPSTGDLRRVKVLFELQGNLTLQPQDKTGKQDNQTPVEVRAELVYHEKSLQADAKSSTLSRSVRHYETASAVIQYKGGTVRPRLRDDRRIVALGLEQAPEAVLFSPLGPLDHDELDLVSVPANSALVNALLPNRAARVGETWRLETDWLAALLGMDAVHTADIACKLDRVEKGLAVVHLQGNASGASDGVSHEMTVAAKYSYDLKQHRITWLAMSLKEKRALGHAHPGTDATARVQMSIEGSTNVPTLDNKVLADLNLEPDEPSRLLEFNSPAGGFQLLVDRKWHVMVDRTDVSVLRMVDRGDLIAQCNISSLPSLEQGETFSLVDFQQDIQRALANHFGEFLNASESRTDDGIHVMRVAATGKEADSALAIDRVYYHLTDPQGRRVSCVFTYESDLVDRFAAGDQAAVSSFRFIEKTAGSLSDAATRPVPTVPGKR